MIINTTYCEQQPFLLAPTVPLTLAEYLHKALPQTCELGVVSATGIIGTVEMSYQGKWLKRAKKLNREILNYLEGAEDEEAAQCQPRKRMRRENENKNEEEAENPPQKAEKSWKSNVGYSIEVEQYSPAMVEADAVSIVTIPYHPGVKVNFFNISSQKFYSDFVSLALQCCWILLFVLFSLLNRVCQRKF